MVQCGSHKRIQCWSFPYFKIRTIHHPTRRAKFHPRSYFSGISNPESMWNSDYIFWTTSEAFGQWFAPQRKRFGRWSSWKTCLYTFFWLQLWSSSQYLTPSSPLPSTTMCFHRWPFINRGLFGNPSKVIWSVNREGISLGMRLVCLGVSSTIMVSCSLEAHVSPPTVELLICPISWSHWYNLPPINSFRFLCNKLKKLQHYCNVLFIYQ